jgi:hypothetical protein
MGFCETKSPSVWIVAQPKNAANHVREGTPYDVW